MRIHFRNLRSPLRIQVRHHVHTRPRLRLGIVLLVVGAFLIMMGFAADGLLDHGKSIAGTHLELSNWLVYGGLVVLASGALVSLRRSHLE